MKPSETSRNGEDMACSVNEDSQMKEDSSETDNQSESTKHMSTYELLNNPLVLKQGLGYLSKLNSQEMTAEEVSQHMGIGKDVDVSQPIDDALLMPPPPPKMKPKQHFSPGINFCTSETKMKKHKKSRKSKKAGKSNRYSKTKRDVLMNSTSTEGIANSDSVDVTTEVEVDTQMGRELVKQLMSRCTDVEPEKGAVSHNEEQGLTFGGVGNFVSGYAEKSARYKQNSQLIKNLTEDELIETYDAIRGELKEIFDGIRSSVRHTLYLEGWSKSNHNILVKEKALSDLNVSIPFTGEHGMILIMNLNNHLIPKSDVPQFAKYISYVLLPEAFIRIYGRLTGQSYDMAQLELRFGDCYDETIST